MLRHNTLVYCPPLNGKEPVLLYSRSPLQDCSTVQITEQQQHEAGQFIRCWQQTKASRFNRYRDSAQLPPGYVLVIIQPQLDGSLLQAMLQYARQLALHAGASVLLCHDEHLPYQLPVAVALTENCDDMLRYCPADVHHATVLENAHCVVTADSWLGFEALLWRKPVYSFLPSFYAALTDYRGTADHSKPPSEQGIELAQWVWLLFFQHASSVHPEQDSGGFTDVTAALHWLALQRSQRQRFAPTLYAIGFNYHWRSAVKSFFQGSALIFVPSALQVPAHSHAIVWGRRDISSELAEGVALCRLEDGFLRSVGLGIQFSRPLSWVADSSGLYFDATVPSALEIMLAQHELGPELQQRAMALISDLVSHGISKYNTGAGNWQRPQTDKTLILVPGQVESDASIAYGCCRIKTNLGLLKAVREANPDAYIIYKPHPDVVAGARASGNGEQQAAQFCDLVLEHVSITAVIAQVEEVHVLTSLCGFESLIRQKKVHCYGMPFYAGWGLTVDHCVMPRRQRQLTLAQLVAASLLLYPLYISRNSGYYCSPEQTLQQLTAWRKQGITTRQRVGIAVRKMINRLVGAK